MNEWINLQLGFSQQMIRISKLLRLAKPTTKLPARAGPGWDRPDVPPSQRVQPDRRWTQTEIIYTFFDSSMPEFFITEPEIYEGTPYEALPQLASMWGVFLGTAVAIYVFLEMVNPLRKHYPYEPTNANYFLNQMKRLNEEKVGLKWAKENPFGITIAPEKFPVESEGIYMYPRRYNVVKSSLEHAELINKQAAEYLKRALERASTPQTNSHQAHH